MTQTAVELQRSQGNLRVRLDKLGDHTVLGDLYQQGCLKARLPQRSAKNALEVVTINTAGGLTDGDSVATSIEWNAGTCGVVTTQAAERIYHCRHDAASITTTLNIGDHAVACWLPQETILFDHSRLERQTDIVLGDDAILFAVESLVFGRIAMQEIVSAGQIFDRLRIRQGGRLILADALALGHDGQPIDKALDRPSTFGSARCCATVVVAGSDSDVLLDLVRSTIEDSPVDGGASNLGPLIAVRLLAQDSKSMRELVLRLYAVCMDPFNFSTPRVWHC